MDILHRVGMKGATPDEVYTSLTTVDGLAGWWARDTSEVDGILQFRFGPGGIDMKVLEQVPGKRVLWEVVGGPAEWIGTTVKFDITQSDDFTIVLFAHEGWAEPVEFMYHCSTKWATYLVSLKQLVETGTGAPDPDDLLISDWH
jgi:uncharacterized protein YndB with AHSA1/START domain